MSFVRLNSIEIEMPQLLIEWDYGKNSLLKPNEISAGSKKKVWWKCKNQHSWQESPAKRRVNKGCPYCTGNKIISGYNDLLSLNPLLVEEWDFERNSTINPTKIGSNSNKKVWWKCKNGHQWEAVVSFRNRGGGCPICSNKLIVAGINDFASIHPELMNEWNYARNIDVNPTTVAPSGGQNVWWICAKGHEYKATLNKRHNGAGCPYCANKKVLTGFNDLATTNPRLASEWHSSKNGNLLPTDIVEGSKKIIWWQCKRGHEWKATPCNRTRNRNCPICSKQLRTSFPEQAIYFYCKQFFDNVENGNLSEIGMELDVYIPKISTAIEYDGINYHASANSLKREKRKNDLCAARGIRLIRVREKGLSTYNECECIFVETPIDNSSLESAIKKVFLSLGINNVSVDLERDTQDILAMYLVEDVKNNLEQVNNYLSQEWNYEKNGDLLPSHLSANSSKVVWWICKHGHEWQASLHNRSKGKGCPYCSGRVAIKGENDLKTKCPDIAAEWDYEKNGDLAPEDVKYGSNVKVWWKCNDCGYSWITTVSNRTRGTGCPTCGELKKGPKRKSPQDFVEELKAINPNIIVVGQYVVSTKKVKCHCVVCKNEWEALPGNLLKGKGCAKCALAKRNRRDVLKKAK